jgi:uncharacterized protein (DUF2267 family)
VAEQPAQSTTYDRLPDDAWRYERFLTTIQRHTGLDRDHAERAAMATIGTLAERIAKERAQELAEDLPERLRFWLQDATDEPEELNPQEFVHRVSEREEVDAKAAARHARVVFYALARVAPAYEFDDLVGELPRAYDTLFGDVARQVREHTKPEVRSLDAFIERVKRRADLDRLEAERAAETVLETLAERLAPTRVEELQAALPKLFREALQRGTVRAHGRPRELSLDEFVDRVAHEESVSFDDAFEHTRTVFATLAEALPSKVLTTVLHELPQGYRATLL